MPASPAPERPTLPSEIRDLVDWALYGDPAMRAEELAQLVAAYPQHTEAIERLVAVFERSQRQPAEDAPHERFGRYELHTKLGEGTYGEVFVAREAAPLQRHVALKIFKPKPGLAERLQNELAAIARLNHDHIARAYSTGEHDGLPYLAMEYVEEAQSLSRHCDQAKLGLRHRLELFLQACDAMQHAHDRGVLHLDLKPGNILARTAQYAGSAMLEGAVKVVDFGQARVQAAAGDAEVLRYGTPPYMAPEQLRTHDVDGRADVYALGVTLFELLTGQLPYNPKELDAATSVDALEELYRIATPKPSASLAKALEIGAAIPIRPRTLASDLDWIVARATAKDATERYATVRDLASDVRRYLQDRPVAARPDSVLYVAGKALRRLRRPIAGVAFVGALSALGFVYWAQKPVSSPTVTPFSIPPSGAAKLQPSELRPGEAVGVRVVLPRPARVVALSTTASANDRDSTKVQPLRPSLVEREADGFALKLEAGTHNVLLCSVEPEGVDREGLWVFVLEDDPLDGLILEWVADVKQIADNNYSEWAFGSQAMDRLAGMMEDSGSRGGTIEKLTEEEKRRLAAALDNMSRDESAWPSELPQRHVFWWDVKGGAPK